MNGFVDMKPEELFLMSHNTGTRGHGFKLFKKHLKKGLNLRKFFLSQRVVDAWNKFPEDVVSVRTTNQFTENRIDYYWKKHGYGVLRLLSEILMLIGSAMFIVTFNLVTRVGLL